MRTHIMYHKIHNKSLTTSEMIRKKSEYHKWIECLLSINLDHEQKIRLLSFGVSANFIDIRPFSARNQQLEKVYGIYIINIKYLRRYHTCVILQKNYWN